VSCTSGCLDHSVDVSDFRNQLSTIGERRSLPWLVAFFACTAAVLVPTPLVEPRYFMVPYTIMSIHSIRPDTKEGARLPWKQLCFNMAVNAVTLLVFLTVKFTWDGWEGWMRFMW
jgi:alpha-1,2-glucosyltransferase